MLKQKIESIHYMRIIACLMVVLIHVSATPVTELPLNSLSQVIFVAINQLSKPAVPIFIFISGFLLHHIYGKTRLSLMTFYVKRLPNILNPYLAWSFVYYLLYVILGQFPLSPSFLISGLIWGTFTYHLYFMVIIIQMYLLYPLIHWLTNRLGALSVFILLLILQLLLIKMPFGYRDRIFITYLCYFNFGVLLRTCYDKIHFEKIQPFFSFILYLFIGMLNMALFYNLKNSWIQISIHLYSLAYVLLSLSAILLLFLMVESAMNRTNKMPLDSTVLATLSAATQNIYYAHPLFIMFAKFLLIDLLILPTSIYAPLALLFILVTLVPIAYYIESSRVKQ